MSFGDFYYNAKDSYQKEKSQKMLKRFSKYICQSVAAMIGQSVYILADTFFISFNSGANGLAALNLILPVFGIMFAIGSMIGIGSATRYGISKAKGEDADHYFTTVNKLESGVQCSIYTDRYFDPG